MPAAAPTGEFHWRVSLLDEVGSPVQNFDMRPSLRVTVPERTFDAPPLPNRIGADFGDFATLLGFDLANTTVAPDGVIDLTLFWQARAETSTPYKVFVHVLDGAGHIVAQADAVPANGDRPTTGWLPPEVVLDRHTIRLPGNLSGGVYRIQAGLYNADTGARLRTREGDDFIFLTGVEVKQ